MNNKIMITGLAVAVLVGGLFSASQAEQSGQIIYGCTTPKNGTVMRVATSPVTCPAGTTPIEWGAGSTGPKGDKGETGLKGETGPQGPKGDKGEPGLSYEDALASANEESSPWVIYSGISHIGGDFCVGPTVNGYRETPGYGQICTKDLIGASSISILSTAPAMYNGQLADPQPLFISSNGCPTSYSDFSSLRLKPVAYILGNSRPFKIALTSPNSCLILQSGRGYTADMGMYQIVIKTNN